MRNIVYIFLVGFLLACSSQVKLAESRDIDQATAPELVSDSVEYELIVFDIGFDSWFATNNNRAAARSESYYKHWNQFYVSEWNRLYMEGSPFFENYIEYDPFEDYGFDINYKLYKYFIYIEKELGIKLLNR